MTVLENVLVGHALPDARRPRRRPAGAARRARASGSRRIERGTRAAGASSASVCCRAHDEPASTLSYANRRRLEIARALATEPKLLLLDEPAAGMNPTEKRELREDILRIRERGVTILLIEHDMAAGAGHLRARGGARPRRQDRGGQLSGRCGATPRCSRRTSAQRPPMLEPDRLCVEPCYGPHAGRCKARQPEVQQRRDRLPAGRQRRGQVDHAEDHPRPGAARAPAASSSRASASTACRPRTSSAAASRWCPESRRIFARMTVWENLAMGAYSRRGRAARRDRRRTWSASTRCSRG